MSIASPQVQNLIDRPARFVRKPKPAFRTNVERERYWDKEMDKWLHGDPVSGLCGPQYFQLQEVIFKDAYGQPIRPFWRQTDEEQVYATYMEARKTEWDAFYVKRREYGLTSIFGGSLPLWTAMAFPGSTSIMTSADKDRLKDLYSQKLLYAYDNLDPDIKSPKAKTRQEGYLFLAQEEGTKKSEKRWSGLQSQVVGKETVKTPTSLEAYRALYGFLDELFLHPKALTVHGSASRCFMRGFQKVGTMVIGGTCGFGETPGIAYGKKIYKDSNNMRILTCFLKGTVGISYAPEYDQYGNATGKILDFCPNGWNNEAAAYEWIMRRREQLEKAEDKTLYYKFIADYPLTIEEVLNLVPDAVLPQQILFMLDAAEKKIASEGIIQQPYDLIRLPNNEVQAAPSKVSLDKAKFVIIHLPEPGMQYGSGTDPIPFGNAALEEGSDYAIVIKRLRDQRHVAYYKERNLDPEETVKNAIMLQDLYKGPQTMLEFTRGEVAMLSYQNIMRTDLLAEMPQHLGITFEKRKFPWGVSKNPHIEARLNKYLLQWLWKHAHNVRLKLLIDELRQYLKLNHDLLDAVMMELLKEENDLAKLKRINSKQIAPVIVTEVVRDANGVTRRVTRTVNTVTDTTVGEMMDRHLGIPRRG